jgi:hypothetical protein
VPGLVAVINTGHTSVAESSALELAAAYETLRGPCRRASFAAGNFATVVKLFDPALDDAEAFATRPDGSWVCTAGASFGDAPLGDCAIDRLDGQFAYAAYDVGDARLVVGTDPFGMYPLYVATANDLTYFSTSALALARVLHTKADRLGLLLFLRTGYQFGGRTNWQGITRLDPGTYMTFDGGPARPQTYFRPARDDAVTRLGLTDAADHCCEVAIAKYRRAFRAATPTWADLTGGYDTRLANLLLERAGVDLRTNTVGEPDDEDVTIAAEVARVAGWPWVRFAPPATWPDDSERFLRLALAWGDGHLDALHLAESLWSHAQKRPVCARLVGGAGGEHLQYFPWQSEFLHAGRRTTVDMDRWVRSRLLKPVPTTVFREFPTRDVYDDLASRMAAWAKPYAGELNTTQLDVMYAYKVTGHFGAYGAAAHGFVTSRAPFYDKDVFTATFSVDFRHRNQHRLMRRMMERLDRRVARVVTTRGGPAETPRLTNAFRYTSYYTRLARKGVTKLSDMTIGRPLLLPAVRVSEVAAATRRAVLDRGVDGVPLAPAAMRSADLYDPAALGALFDAARREPFAGADLFGRVVTVEAALAAAGTAV